MPSSDYITFKVGRSLCSLNDTIHCCMIRSLTVIFILKYMVTGWWKGITHQTSLPGETPRKSGLQTTFGHENTQVSWEMINERSMDSTSEFQNEHLIKTCATVLKHWQSRIIFSETDCIWLAHCGTCDQKGFSILQRDPPKHVCLCCIPFLSFQPQIWYRMWKLYFSFILNSALGLAEDVADLV